MGTNYYASILPTKERKKELHDAIEANDFPLVKKLSDEATSLLLAVTQTSIQMVCYSQVIQILVKYNY